MNYFFLFNMPIQFSIDKKKLEKKFYLLQKKYHPDRLNMSKQKNIKYFYVSSSIINKAYNILKDKFKRAKYLLKIYEKKKHLFNKNFFPNEEMLYKQFKLYKKVEKFKKKINNKKKLKKIEKETEKKIKIYFLKIDKAFKEKKIKFIKEILYKLLFRKKLLIQIKE